MLSLIEKYESVHPGTVLIRCDFNIPLDGSNLSKIEATKSTVLDKCLEGNKIIMMTHMGENDSVKSIIKYIEQIFGIPIGYSTIDDISEERVSILENLRSHPGEKSNDDDFARLLGSLGNIYINDAFPSCHRKHASLDKIKSYVEYFYISKNLSQEILSLTEYFDREFIWIIGGKKVLTKLDFIPRGYKTNIILGGVPANCYFHFNGFELGSSYVEDYDMDFANFIPPVDVVVSSNGKIRTISTELFSLKHDEKIIDVGPKSLDKWSSILKGKNCIWNGSISLDVNSETQMKMMNMIQQLCTVSIVGGGDTKFCGKFTHVSNGGGALIYLMANRRFPIPIYK